MIKKASAGVVASHGCEIRIMNTEFNAMTKAAVQAGIGAKGILTDV